MLPQMLHAPRLQVKTNSKLKTLSNSNHVSASKLSTSSCRFKLSRADFESNQLKHVTQPNKFMLRLAIPMKNHFRHKSLDCVHQNPTKLKTHIAHSRHVGGGPSPPKIQKKTQTPKNQSPNAKIPKKTHKNHKTQAGNAEKRASFCLP